ncbi:MAG: UDP-N-acetylmuramate dehydrogenase [Erysipelotrichaceae bacterium]|nr:UDP-N-acetylmuramate dehydrogenase [Erysipelotrichaceae bacterium]
MSDFINRLQQYGAVETNVSFQTMTTFRIGGNADYVFYPKDSLSLAEALRFIKKEQMDYKLIGKGSNLLCSDADYHGVIIRLDRTFVDFYYEDTTLVAKAGCSVIALAYDTMKQGLSGLEFASGIPGSVGGAVFMNAGAYKSSMKDIVKEVLVYKEDDFEWMKKEDCGFDYRTSVFQKHPDWIVLAVRFQLTKEDPKVIRELIESRRKRRMETQPLNYPSAGSIFRNPDGSFAWKYIDELGLRGKVIGGAQISSKHSNFIVNVNHAKAKDVMELVDMVNQGMEKTYGFTLKMEVEKFNWENQ